MSQQINLYSPIFRKQKKVFSAVAMLQGLVVMLVVIAGFAFYVSLQTRLLEVRAGASGQRLKSELERLKVSGVSETPEERAKALAERKKRLEARLGEYHAALRAAGAEASGGNEGYSALLHALARLSMDGVWLTRIETSESGGELSITGRATRPELVAAYLARLRAEAALRGKQFRTLEITRPEAAAKAPSPYVEFVLSSGEPGAKK